jgi:hypothetical protein
MVRSVNADGPKYIMDASKFLLGVEGCLTAEELVRREIEELHADPKFVNGALDSNTIEADEEAGIMLRKMARLHEGVAKRVFLLFLLRWHILMSPEFSEMFSELSYPESSAL